MRLVPSDKIIKPISVLGSSSPKTRELLQGNVLSPPKQIQGRRIGFSFKAMGKATLFSDLPRTCFVDALVLNKIKEFQNKEKIK